MVGVVILGLWAVSTHWTLGYIYRYPSGIWGSSVISEGCAEVKWVENVRDADSPRKWTFPRYRHGFTLGQSWPDVNILQWDRVWVAIPLWLPFALALIPTALLWHRDRRTVKPGCCRQCGYDLRASKKTCPECGTGIT